jgi:hypothetical protein
MSDAAEAIPNGAKEVWAAVTRFMCSVHVHQAVGKQCKSIPDINIRREIISDINSLALCWSNDVAVVATNLFIKKWGLNQLPAVIALISNFKDVWMTDRLFAWYRGKAPKHPVNQNGLESKNKVIKDEYSFRAQLGVLQFLNVLCKYLHDRPGARAGPNPPRPGPVKVGLS